MSRTTINAPAGVHGGEGWKPRDIRRARPSPLDSVGNKQVLLVASIAFLLTLLVPFLAFSQVVAGTLSVPDPIALRGNLGRNTLTGPGLLNFDLSVVKNNYLKRVSDAFNVQFRTEFFNVSNRANFAPPLDNRNIFDATRAAIANAGLITSTQTPSRQIQLALKIIW